MFWFLGFVTIKIISVRLQEPEITFQQNIPNSQNVSVIFIGSHAMWTYFRTKRALDGTILLQLTSD